MTDRKQLAWIERELQFYPRPGDLMPTRLGNVLKAAEDRAGGRYGLNTYASWPRLFPLLSDQLARIVGKLNDQLDTASHLCVTFLLATLLSSAFLLPNGWDGYWLLIPLGAGLLTLLSYRATITAAKKQGTLLMVAFDLHRFDLLEQLRYPVPEDAKAEFEFNEKLSALLRVTGAASRKQRLEPDGQLDPKVDYYIHPDSTTSPRAPQAATEPDSLLWEWEAVLGRGHEESVNREGRRSPQ